MEMQVLERSDQMTHVALSGRFDATGAAEIEERFSAATVGRQQPTIVDLTEVEFLASMGIGRLFAASKALKNAGHKLVLVNPQGMVRAVLRSSSMDKVMPIADDLEQAIRLLHGEQETSRGPSPAAAKAPKSRRPRLGSDFAPVAAKIQLAIKNDLHELSALNVKLAQFLADHSVPPRAVYAIDLAIEELVVNVIRYAYVDDDEHTIEIDLAIEGDQLLLRIADDGRPFDPRRGPKLNLHTEDCQVGGLGLILVLDLVDKLKYARVDEKNLVEVRVRLSEDDEGDGAPPTGNE